MNRKIPSLLNGEFGIFYSRPIVNMYMDKLPTSEWREFIKVLDCMYAGEDSSAIVSMIEHGLNRSTRNRSLFYLLLSLRLLVSNGESDELYNKLRREFGRIPSGVRKEVAWVLTNYYGLYHPEREIRVFRVWSEVYEKESSARILLLVGRARNAAQRGNRDQARDLFEEALKMAKKLEDPQGLINVLNDYSWYMKQDNIEYSLKLAERAAYYSGYYDEKLSSASCVLDTLSIIQHESKDKGLYKTIELQRMTGFEKDGPLQTLRDRLAVVELEQSEYPNEDLTRSYLKKHAKNVKNTSRKTCVAWDNLSYLLNGRTRRIRGVTLRKIIVGLEIAVDLLNDPFPIVNEYVKSKVEESFEIAINELGKLSSYDAKKLVLSTYSALRDRMGSFPYLCRKGVLLRIVEACSIDLHTLKEIAKRRYELMKFIGQLFDLHPFLEGRRDAAMKFLDVMPKRKSEEFISGYLQLTEKERVIIDTFMRNYARYNRDWGVRLEPISELKLFVQEYGLKNVPSTLAYWVLDTKRCRTKLVNLLMKFS
ncbi:tetratricopeptide repeat protein [Mesotoga sp. TolDC]|uniref:tetratricopeptide repeat protein n=1 Tax=Mesotoga sp. TolDC TaxID=1389250 RepID=UPI000DA6D22F|nr:tetratricopeptide repeat protein [Mesotoga sp. TolDC]PZC52401.1 hypothetical protein LH53_05000 [Mesotoga sp. TolDC]